MEGLVTQTLPKVAHPSKLSAPLLTHRTASSMSLTSQLTLHMCNHETTACDGLSMNVKQASAFPVSL